MTAAVGGGCSAGRPRSRPAPFQGAIPKSRRPFGSHHPARAGSPGNKGERHQLGTTTDGLSGAPKPILNLLVYFSSSSPKKNKPTWEKLGWRERHRLRSQGKREPRKSQPHPGRRRGSTVRFPTPAFCNRGEGAPSVRLSRLLNKNRPDLTQRVSPRISSKQLRCLEIAGVTEALITVITH